MIKETAHEETRLFSHIFYHWWHFDWGGGRALGYVYAQQNVLTGLIEFSYSHVDITLQEKNAFLTPKFFF